MMMELGEPFIPARDTDSWALQRGYQNQDALEAVRVFTSTRMQTVDILRNLTNEWSRKARHAIFGPTDLQELVKFMAEHDRLHIRQICATVEQLAG